VETRALADMHISAVGVGTAPIGSGRDWPVWWGPQDEAESIRTIHTALDLGVNWIDTAPFYGWGRAEDVAIRADVEASLRRLRRERVDLLQLHDVDRSTPIEESWREVQRLIQEGKVRHGGISNHPAADVERARAVGPVAALQYQYNLLHREPEADILQLGIGVLAWSPLASGFLAGGFDLDRLVPDDFRRTHPFAQRDLEPLRAQLAEIGARHGRTAAQVAVAWVLRHPGVAGAIVGVRTPAEARELPGALGLPPEELESLVL
jgi:aryl-alcohol dehydrogenase-like predicted oxidoreductase